MGLRVVDSPQLENKPSIKPNAFWRVSALKKIQAKVTNVKGAEHEQ